jgi:hypothetical protein
MLCKNAIIIITFLINYLTITSLSIPFYSHIDLKKSTSIEEILDFFKNNEIYTYIEIGEPSQKLPVVITSYDSTLTMKKFDCPMLVNYDLNYSKSSEITVDDAYLRYLSIKDYISFDNNDKNIFMKFYYHNQTDGNNSICGFIGTQIIDEDNKDNTNNMMIQLKNMHLINNPVFYFNYTDDNKGFLNIGFEPFEANPKLYSKYNMKRIGVDFILDYEMKNENRGKFRWNLNFTKVFYHRNLPAESKLDPYVEISRIKTRRVEYFQALFFPEDDLIKGPFEYEEHIEEDFFDSLIDEGICKRIIYENKYFFVCSKEHKNLLKKTFPTLYFYSESLNHVFQLNSDDLFIEKDEYLIFGIYFDCFQIEVFRGAFLSEWFFGKTFLKKYCFSFNPETEQLTFYKESIIRPRILKPEEETNNNITKRI